MSTAAAAEAAKAAELEKTLRQLEQVLAERERAITEAESRLADRERDLAEMEALLIAREQLLAASKKPVRRAGGDFSRGKSRARTTPGGTRAPGGNPQGSQAGRA
jgi:hypothetical protein